MKSSPILVFFLVVLTTTALIAGTTGKIVGVVKDAETGEAMPGVNVIVDGTTMGAATNMDGYYAILNVPPGTYVVKAKMVGYAEFRVTGLKVEIDLTTTYDIKMKTQALMGEEVTVVAQRPVVQQDISASEVNVSMSQVETLPIQRVSEVVGVQAGVLGLAVRGGNENELAFMLDGATLRDERTNQPITNISMSSVKEVKVQTGGFNAEYGNVRSGIVNVVTYEGEKDRYNGSVRFEYSPAAQKHFGPSAFDPNSYWNRPFLDDAVAWTGTKSGAWDAYTQRQYPSFVGWDAISKQTLEDANPSNDLSPEAAQRVYKYQHRKQGDIKDPDFILDGGFGGPVPLVSKKLGGLRFFVSHNRERDMYLVPLSREAVDQNSTQLKLTSNITSSIKLTVGALYSELFGVNNNNNGLPGYFSTTNELASAIAGNTYKDAIVYGTDYWCPTSIYRHSLSLRLTHTLSSKTFYEASLERFGSFYKTIPRDMRDTSRVVKFGSSYWLDEAPFGFMPLPSTGINGLRMGVGMSNSRDYSKLYTMTGKFDIISQVNSTNQVKAGAELTYNDHNVKYGSIDITLPAGRPWSIWQQQPLRGALYLQDKVEFKGMIANVGVRYDYSNARSDWYDIGVYDRTFWGNQYTPELENTVVKTPTKAQSYFSPRLGVSHPITSSSKLYFNYGHFREMPTAEELYLVQRYTDNTLSRIGDPNLELSRTVAYELGYEQNVLNQLLFRLAAYYRDNMYQPNSVQYISADNKVSYYKRENNNYQDIRGFEVTMERRAGAWLTGIVNYTYMVYTSGYFGKLKQYENPAEQRTYDRDNIYQEKPLPQPYFKANLALRTPLTFGPRIAGFRPLSDWVIGSQFYWRVGSYYTWTGGASVAGVTYNTRYPNYYNLDLRISKSFTYKKYRLELYANVNNTLDYKYLSTSSFSDGLDQRDYQNSLYWPREVGQFISGGYSRYGLEYGTDRFGALRPKGVAYDPFELVLANPNSDPAIDAQNKDIIARNKKRVETKSYIDNPNMEWLYYLNPRDIYFGIRIEF